MNEYEYEWTCEYLASRKKEAEALEALKEKARRRHARRHNKSEA